MLNSYAVSIPLSKVKKIEIYVNAKRKSMDAVKRETGCQYILNGTLYDMQTFKVNCHMKSNGRVYGSPNYTVYGYSWNAGDDIAFKVLPNADKNYIACTNLIKDGKPIEKLIYATAQGGKRGRSAIGLKAGKLCLYCSKDGTDCKRSPETLRNLLVSYGWESAIMLDGGGSSQCDFVGKRIYSSRRVQHYILVYVDDGEPEGRKPMVEINAYSKKKQGEKQLSANFKVKEFACKDGSDAILVAPKLVMLLQTIRSYYGKAVVVNSAYRTPQYNAKVGGVEQSQHCYGTAADISISGVKPSVLAEYIRKLMPDFGGVGIYSSFVHVDVREERADWKG